MPVISVNIESSTGLPIGPGPISALNWRHTRRMDRAGLVSFSAPATDPRVGILALRRYAHCYGQIAGTRTDLGLGIIDKIDLDTNQRDLTVGGDDLMRELAFRSVGNLALTGAGETVITIAAALDAIIALAPGWTLDRTTYVSSTVDVFYTFSGESILAALAKAGALTGTHFRLGVGRQIVWLFDAQPSSGIRAVIGVDPIAAESNRDICLITNLGYIQDSSEVISRVYPHGSGTGTSRLDLTSTTRSAPVGYVLDTSTPGNTFIERTASEVSFGFAERHQSFNDIAPGVPDTDPDYATALISASDALFDAALEYLRTHSYPQETYKLSVTKLDRLVLPGETIRVIYNGWVSIDDTQYKWVSIDADLIILEATTEITDAGIHTPSLVVAAIARWPVSDKELVVSLARQVAQSQAHDQPVLYAQSAGTSTSVDGVTVASGKTLTVSNTLGLSGTDGEALALTGSLTVGADTTISGGGTLALAGFTATVPGTGTLVLSTDTRLSDDRTPTAHAIDGALHTGVLTSAKGGTGVNNAGSLTLATSAAITGGGTLALGGFTATVPSTGTVAMIETSPRLLNKTVAPVTIVSDATEQTLYSFSVPGGTLSTTNKLRLVLHGKFFDNTGTNYAPRIRIYYGATCIYDDTPAAVATNAAARPWSITCDLTAAGATNSQVAHSMTFGGGQNGLLGVTVGNNVVREGVYENVPEDSTAAKTLSVTVTLPVSHANLSFTAYSTFLELLRG